MTVREKLHEVSKEACKDVAAQFFAKAVEEAVTRASEIFFESLREVCKFYDGIKHVERTIYDEGIGEEVPDFYSYPKCNHEKTPNWVCSLYNCPIIKEGKGR